MRRVLEIGCFEGVHTIGLAAQGADVHATDARVVVKTMVRCRWYGVAARVSVWDVVHERSRAREYACDLVHHVGMPYHLIEPVSHLQDMGGVTRSALMLDTHVARDDAYLDTNDVAGRGYRYLRHGEHGRGHPFSGMGTPAKWLRLGDLVDMLGDVGFDEVDVVEWRDERDGPRVLFVDAKSGG